VIFSIFQCTDHRFRCEAVTDGIAAGAVLALFCPRTSAFVSIATVRLDLRELSHGGQPLHWLRFVIQVPFNYRLITLSIFHGGRCERGRAFVVHFGRSSRNGSVSSHSERAVMGGTTPPFFPPAGFITRAMSFAMIPLAQRHRKFITDLAA
jgi:hypothetical protein